MPTVGLGYIGCSPYIRDKPFSKKLGKDQTNAPALEAVRLRIGYRVRGKDLSLAADVDFSLPVGSFTAVVGVNGVGKSTLLRTLTGMQPALGGGIRIQGHTMGQISPVRRAKLLSVVLTEPLASGNLRVSELVSLGRHPYTNWLGVLSAEDRLLIRDALLKMELDQMADHPCHTLSDGQLQRALIARALAQDTPVMVLDEPTTHLDLYHKVKILKLLQEVAHTTDTTILFSTHEIDLAIQLCDHLVILQPGSVSFGTPCELIEKGAFERLFPGDAIRFDPETGRFRIQK